MTRRRRRAWSPYKDIVIAYVQSHPGCSKLDVARRVTHHPYRSPTHQYYIVDTALRHGWIVGCRVGNRYQLYTPDMAPPYVLTRDPAQRRKLCLAQKPMPRWGTRDRLGPFLPEADSQTRTLPPG